MIKAKMSTFERRIEILFMIINRRYVTLSELTQCFSIHRNTAMKDVSFLSRYAPIYTKNGNGGGIFLLDEYTNKLFGYLSNDEQQLLCELMQIVEPRKQIILQGILNKFSMPKESV